MLDRIEEQLRRQPGRTAAPPEGELRRAAVAAVVEPERGLLFIKRSERVGDPWSGHMAFPGGRVDPTDPSQQAAAERETWEEVGLDLKAHGRLLGPLDEVMTPMRLGRVPMIISPFVYRLERPVPLVPNHEVASLHWFSVERLLAGEGRASFELDWRGQRWQMPCIDLDGVRVWGLTLRMLDDMLERLGADLAAWPQLRLPVPPSDR